MITQGGEVAFVAEMIRQSQKYKDEIVWAKVSIKIGWPALLTNFHSTIYNQVGIPACLVELQVSQALSESWLASEWVCLAQDAVV